MGREIERRLVRSTRDWIPADDAPLINRYLLPEISLNVNLPIPKARRDLTRAAPRFPPFPHSRARSPLSRLPPLSCFPHSAASPHHATPRSNLVSRDSVRLRILFYGESLLFHGTMGRPRLRLADSNVFSRVHRYHETAVLTRGYESPGFATDPSPLIFIVSGPVHGDNRRKRREV